MKRILVVTTDKYPDGDAGAVRTATFVKVFREYTDDITVVSFGKSTDFEFEQLSNCRHISLRSKNNSLFNKIINLVFFSHRLKKYVLSDHKKYDVIWFTGITKHVLDTLKRYSKKNHSVLIYDCVEWYSPEQFKYGKYDLRYIQKDKFNSRWVDKSIKVVSISSYLHNYYSSKGISSVRIPVILDVKNTKHNKDVSKEKVVFLYAGSPGKKDYLDTVIKGFCKLSQDQLKKMEFRIIGITREQLLSSCGVEIDEIQYLGNSLICLGRVSRDEVLKQLEKADFTVLLRSETQRYAKAGFPTKFVESLTTATPVIANLTSDLGMYLKDNQNGFVVSQCEEVEFAKTIEISLSMSYEDRKIKQSEARITAEKYFHFGQYSGVIEKLLD